MAASGRLPMPCKRGNGGKPALEDIMLFYTRKENGNANLILKIC